MAPCRTCTAYSPKESLGNANPAAGIDVRQISMETFHTFWQETRKDLNWDCLFVLPPWLDPMHRHISQPGQLSILTVQENGRYIGAAPLRLHKATAYFLGNPELCDYQDIICAPGHATKVVGAIVNHLRQQNIKRLDWQTLRPQAHALQGLIAYAQSHGLHMDQRLAAVSHETALPEDWESFLQQLNNKQRHEVRRKLRRLDELSPSELRIPNQALHPDKVPDEVLDGASRDFIHLFRQNRKDKAEFMTDQMAAYFHALFTTMARAELAHLTFIQINDCLAAAALSFDFNGTRYLYNNGYNTRFSQLSVGMLSKVFNIRDAISAGCHTYDFLKGKESYKKRLGGHPIHLYRCKIELTKG